MRRPQTRQREGKRKSTSKRADDLRWLRVKFIGQGREDEK
jgi:hypothetical protein